MHRIVCCARAAVMLFFAGCFAIAQIATGPAGSTSEQREPYTAEFKITSLQTLADGTTITHESTEIDARDSQGRALHFTTQQTPGGQAVSSTRIDDPAGNTETDWNSQSQRVRVVKLPPKDKLQGCWSNDSGNFRTFRYEGPRRGKPAPNGTPLPDGGTLVPAQRLKPQIDDLGTTTIQGIEVHGRKLTYTTPTGEIGNDQPIVMVTESWSSPKLGLTLREIRDDPRGGKRTRELASLTLDEPDPALFQPPEGYGVTEEELHPVACPSPK